MSRIVNSILSKQRKCFEISNRFALLNTRKFSQRVRDEKEIILTEMQGDDSGITIVGLNRPQAKNAFNMSLATKLEQIVDSLAVNSTLRVLVVSSAVPGIFCSGADLKERITLSQQQVSVFVQGLRQLMKKIHEFPVPVIAAIDGLALGGGLELALACDIRVAASIAKMGLVETKLAIIPGAGGSQRLPRLINPAIAKELIYTARIFDGNEAKEMGIVNHSVEQNDAGDAAVHKSLDIAREILNNGPFALKMAKAAIYQGLEVDLNSALKFEESYYAQIIPTKDRVEGLLAFKEKRTPKYTGE